MSIGSLDTATTAHLKTAADRLLRGTFTRSGHHRATAQSRRERTPRNALLKGVDESCCHLSFSTEVGPHP
jgi:hypothetical protein